MHPLRFAFALASALVVLAPLSAAAAPPKIDGFTAPDGVTYEEKDVHVVDYDAEPMAYQPEKASAWKHFDATGKTFRVDFHAKAKAKELEATMRGALAKQGWELFGDTGTITARRPAGSKTEWLKANVFDNWVKAVFVVESDVPHSLVLPEPKATPETFGDADDFPYLGHFPGATLKSTTVGGGAIRANADGEKEAFAGPPTQVKYYQLPATWSPLENVAVYVPALEKAGWTILHSAHGGDSAINARYAKNGRDLYCYIHDGALTVADVGAQNEAKKLADALDKDGHIAIYGIYFDVDKDVLKPESETALQHVLELLKKNPKLKVEVQGHTDDTGDAAHNQKLSDDRAASVKKWLVEKGIAADRLKTKGYGATKPIGDNKTPEGRHKNRRVELAKL